MAGGVITAYANATGLPVLHTVHNVFTACLPLDLLGGVSLGNISDRLYFTETNGKACVDCQATAIQEYHHDQFRRREIPAGGCRGLLSGSGSGAAERSPRGQGEIRPWRRPSNYECTFIADVPGAVRGAVVRKYGPVDNVLDAKQENLVAFQNRTGLTVNPDALLYFWPSRLDPFQRGSSSSNRSAFRLQGGIRRSRSPSWRTGSAMTGRM